MVAHRLLITLALYLISSDLLANDKVLLWIEADKFTSATKGIQTITADHLNQSEEEQNGGRWFLKRSGWDVEASNEVSGEAYIELKDGAKNQPNFDEMVTYDVNLPIEGDYYIWLRCDAPPPCTRYFDIWLDKPRSSEKQYRNLFFAHWNIWSWWLWGETPYPGKPRKIHLSAGKHKLCIGNISQGMRFDKFLITNDYDYIPFGSRQFYFNGTFESPEIVDPHDQTRKIVDMEPRATGWDSFPADRWKIKGDPVSRNHYFFVSEDTSARQWTFSVIRDLKVIFFDAQFSILYPAGHVDLKADALFIFSFQNQKNFYALRFKAKSVELIQVHNGIEALIKSCPIATELINGMTTVSLGYSRDGLSVKCGPKGILSFRLPILAQGLVGVGSSRGGVGFDNIAIQPLNDPKATFDFSAKSDPAFQDWFLIHEGITTPWHSGKAIKKGDILVYRSPFWSNSEVSIEFNNKLTCPISILYPYVDLQNFMQVKVDGGQDGRIHLLRRYNGHEESKGAQKIKIEPPRPHVLSIQSSKGFSGIFWDNNRMIEANEYELLNGTVGIMFHEDVSRMPINWLKVKKNEMIIDNFPLVSSGTLSPEWKILEGRWKITPAFDGETNESDGQLTIQGKGTALIGKKSWRNYLVQISAYIDEGSEFAILGGVESDSSLEFYHRGHEFQLRKVVMGKPLVLAKVTVNELSNGWHRLGLALNENDFKAELDGRPLLESNISGLNGSAGLRNYAGFTAFNNLTIHILSEKPDKISLVKSVDSLVVDIEESLNSRRLYESGSDAK